MATLLGLAVLLVATLLVGAFLGSEPISLLDQFRAARTGGWEAVHPVFREVRFPRLILSALVGGALALSGAVYQAVLRNPLAEPYLLGISSGASAGAILPGFLGIAAAYWAGPIFAFGGAILALALLLGLTRLQGGLRTFNLILTGVILASFFSAGILLAISVSEALAAKGIILRIIGGLAAPTWREVGILAGSMTLAAAAIFPMARSLNLLTLGEEQAASLGVRVDRTKLVALILSSLLTGVAVSICGPIGFVGLIVPHSVRILFGPDHRLLLPAATLAGGIFLVATDTVARIVIAPGEIPVGVITALFGGPFFIGLLVRRKVRPELATS
ncbi:MAG: iron ABC transporter permease [Planctomycetota bacterium]|nr:iron ABC transporter permease [Planctomycetota bacterium]